MNTTASSKREWTSSRTTRGTSVCRLMSGMSPNWRSTHPRPRLPQLGVYRSRFSTWVFKKGLDKHWSGMM
ncbi:hypothetical protein Y1Q_0019745 [Alligator mississippiensis]|uniref:Uncharacterized protein n=1 Tax=Alligator mississippiensis TaxID=8496 RepID=A0A151PEZ0_ALLMI|nr:hypothetical protein Y1Q_0019745 [Alligator mississippiensis]